MAARNRINFGGVTGLVLADLTIDYCRDLDTLANVSQDGVTLAEMVAQQKPADVAVLQDHRQAQNVAAPSKSPVAA